MIRHLVHNHKILLRQIGIVRLDQNHALAGISEVPAEIAEGISAVQDTRIIGHQMQRIFRNHQVPARRDRCALREPECDTVFEAPVAQINNRPAPVMQFDVLVVIIAENGVVHDFIDYHVANAQRLVRRTRRRTCKLVEIRRAVGETSHRHAVFLRGKTHCIHHGAVRGSEEYIFAF